MKFKIKNCSVNISFSFFAAILFFCSLKMGKLYSVALFSALIHETTHIIFIYLFGSEVKQINLNFLGANIIRGIKLLSPLKEMIINVSAPVLNIILYFIFKNNLQMNIFSQVNLVLGIFNLLPYYNFDGGMFLEQLLITFLNERIAKLLMKVISIATIILAFLFVLFASYYNIDNAILLLFPLYMTINLILHFNPPI